jgi:hypothetical protein
MDAQWKAETDARLNALQSQLTSTRKLALGLAVLALCLGGYGVAATLRPTKKIVLEGGGGSLTLEPSQIRLKVASYSTTVSLSGISIRQDDKDGARTTSIGPGTAYLSTSGASINLTASDRDASVTMIAKAGGQAAMSTSPAFSTVRVSSLNDKGVTIEATPERAKVSGIGARFFGIGDGEILPPPTSTPPPAPKLGPDGKPICDPFGAMHGCSK